MRTQVIATLVLTWLLCPSLMAQDGVRDGKLQELQAKTEKDPQNFDLWLQLGQLQFEGARRGRPDLLEGAEQSLARALQLKSNDPRSLVWHGAVVSVKAGNLFQSGKLDEAQRLLTQGFDEMDRGVQASPRDPDLRRLRGHTNLRVPEFFGRTEAGVEDFEIVTADPGFEKIRNEEKSQIYHLLGIGYSRVKKPELAAEMWQKTISTAPESEAAKDAAKRLNLRGAGDSPKTGARTERLTDIPEGVGPIMVVATIAFKQEAGAGGNGPALGGFDEMLAAMKRARGFMGVRLLQSGDQTPMFVAISWWKDRSALVDWYYNPAHQKVVRSFSIPETGSAGKPVKDLISHIGLQFYSPLKGGLTLGESFGPTQKAVE